MSPARRRARRGDGALLREEILEAAEALLLETGSEDAVSIRAVADRVGVTPPSIYRHFADKNTLIFDVCDRQFERFDEYLEAKRSGHVDPVERVKACGRAYVEYGLTYPEHYRIMFMGRHELTPEQYADEIHGPTSAFAALVDSVRDGVEAGRLSGDPYMVATSLWTMVHGITSLLIAKPNFPWPSIDDLMAPVMAALDAGPFAAD